MHLMDKSFLTIIDFSRNGMSGTLADSIPIGSTSPLKYFSVHGNDFSGEMPGTLGNLPELLYLDLSENSFTGNMPIGIFTSNSTQHIFLSNNIGLNPGGIPLEVEQIT